MIEKIKAWGQGDADLYTYADTTIECVALHFLVIMYGVWWCISKYVAFIP